jgi:hypothetical protein
VRVGQGALAPGPPLFTATIGGHANGRAFARPVGFVVLSQKVARFEFENQLFEKIQDWRARC